MKTTADVEVDDAVIHAASFSALPALSMVVCMCLVFIMKPPPILVAACQHLAAGIVLSAVSVELVPIIADARSTWENIAGITIGFCVGVGVLVVVETFCEAEEEEGDDGDGEEQDKGQLGVKHTSPLGSRQGTPRSRAGQYRSMYNGTSLDVRGVEEEEEVRRPLSTKGGSTKKPRDEREDEEKEATGRKDSPSFPYTFLLATVLDAFIDG